jgi:Holliday junction resolvase RusA-like endonuclease
MTFVVFGAPATKGSTVSFMGAHGIVTKTDSTGLASWTQAVGWAARACAVTMSARDTAMTVTAVFQFVKPKGKPKRVYPTVKPDADKVVRALLDALTGVAYVDDAQVVRLVVDKVYGVDARTTITVEERV